MFELLCYVATDGYIAKSDCFSWSRRRSYIGLLASFRIRWFSIIVHFFTHVVKLFYEVSLWSCILNLNRKNRESHTTEFSARNGFHCNDYRTLAVDWVCWLLYFMLSSKWKKKCIKYFVCLCDDCTMLYRKWCIFPTEGVFRQSSSCLKGK